MVGGCINRRTLLKQGVGGGFAFLAGTTPVTARKVASDRTSTVDPFSDFYVEGTKTTQITYRPGEFVERIRWQSPDLKGAVWHQSARS